MAEEKPTLFRLSKAMDNARRHYAAGNTKQAEALLHRVKAQAQEVMLDQQRHMVKDMQHHLNLRTQLKDLTSAAVELAKELKGAGSDA